MLTKGSMVLIREDGSRKPVEELIISDLVFDPACCMGQNMGAGAPFPERLCGTFEDRTTEAGHAVEGLWGSTTAEC